MTKSNAIKLAACIALAVVLWFIPPLAGIDPQAWHLFAIFAPTIVGFVLKPLPIGVLTFIALSLSILTGTLEPSQALGGFANGVVWLIVAAFLFARAMVISGLGHRIAYMLMRNFGRTSLRLAYALSLSDVAVSPVIPSNTARGGGIFYPIVQSTAEVFDSYPDKSRRKIGAFLTQAVFQTDITASALTVTAVAGNALMLSFAADIAGLDISWGKWFLVALLPAVVSIALTPWIVHKIYPPELKETPEARTFAETRLKDLGPMATREKVLLAILAIAIIGWATTPFTGFNATAIAMAAVCAMLVFNVLKWKDVIQESTAWDAMIWMGGILSLATALADLEFFAPISTWASDQFQSVPWPLTLLLLIVIYVLTTYGFASGVAHITAMYPVFLTIAIAAGAPALLSAFTLAFAQSLSQGVTHYASGPAAVFFGGGYVEQREWWRVGGIMAVIQLVIWGVLGLVWWKVIGIW